MTEVGTFVCLGINPEVGGRKLTKTRSATPILCVGYKQLTMAFLVKVKKDPRERAIEFRSCDPGRSELQVVKLSYTFPHAINNSGSRKRKISEVLSYSGKEAGLVEAKLNLST
jgi:hypothetical protein